MGSDFIRHSILNRSEEDNSIYIEPDCYLLHVGFDPEDGGYIFIRNV
jgi:hypothetical protein